MKGLFSFLLPMFLAGSVAYGFYSYSNTPSQVDNKSTETQTAVQNLIGHANQLPASERVGDNFAGNWFLENSDIRTSELFPSDMQYGIEESIWSDLATGETPISINADGSGSFLREGKTKYINVYVKEDESVFQILFQDKNKQSRTDYQYSIKGNKLELSHEDPMVNEKYTFTKR